MARLFLTGATGYLGGEVLFQLSRLPVKHQIRCLVRTDDKAKAIRSAFPSAETVIGDLDDSALIEDEARTAEVVLHLASTKHAVSSHAIVKGLTNKARKQPGYYLQMGGASLLVAEQVKAGAFGEESDRAYNDVADLDAVVAKIRANSGNAVNNLILDQKADDVKTALIVGPIIYGESRGPGNTVTIQGPSIARYALEHNGEALQVGHGKNIWSHVHVADVGKVFTLLLEAALQGKQGLWNENGIYFPESGSISFGDFARAISETVCKRLDHQTPSVKSMTAEELDQIVPHGSVTLGTTAHTKSSRANEYLGWRPTEMSLIEDVPRMVKALQQSSS